MCMAPVVPRVVNVDVRVVVLIKENRTGVIDGPNPVLHLRVLLDLAQDVHVNGAAVLDALKGKRMLRHMCSDGSPTVGTPRSLSE